MHLIGEMTAYPRLTQSSHSSSKTRSCSASPRSPEVSFFGLGTVKRLVDTTSHPILAASFWFISSRPFAFVLDYLPVRVYFLSESGLNTSGFDRTDSLIHYSFLLLASALLHCLTAPSSTGLHSPSVLHFGDPRTRSTLKCVLCNRRLRCVVLSGPF